MVACSIGRAANLLDDHQFVSELRRQVYLLETEGLGAITEWPCEAQVICSMPQSDAGSPFAKTVRFPFRGLPFSLSCSGNACTVYTAGPTSPDKVLSGKVNTAVLLSCAGTPRCGKRMTVQQTDCRKAIEPPAVMAILLGR